MHETKGCSLQDRTMQAHLPVAPLRAGLLRLHPVLQNRVGLAGLLDELPRAARRLNTRLTFEPSAELIVVAARRGSRVPGVEHADGLFPEGQKGDEIFQVARKHRAAYTLPAQINDRRLRKRPAFIEPVTVKGVH